MANCKLLKLCITKNTSCMGCNHFAYRIITYFSNFMFNKMIKISLLLITVLCISTSWISTYRVQHSSDICHVIKLILKFYTQYYFFLSIWIKAKKIFFHSFSAADTSCSPTKMVFILLHNNGSHLEVCNIRKQANILRVLTYVLYLHRYTVINQRR